METCDKQEQQQNDDELRKVFPLHWAVFENDLIKLHEVLDENNDLNMLNKLDVRGRSPLMLAITLEHFDCARLLLERGADACTSDAEHWTIVNEAICSGEADILQLAIKYRDYQKAIQRNKAMQRLLSQLRSASDFYAEMGWEITSWLPFISKMYPSDTCKIWKKGSNVRVDSTLMVASTPNSVKHGNHTFLFRVHDCNPEIVIIDHNIQTAYVDSLVVDEDLSSYGPSLADVNARLSSPVSLTYVDVEKIGFERPKASGLLSWLAAPNSIEKVDGIECKVYEACNIEIVTKTRMEHLSEEDKEKWKQSQNARSLASLIESIGGHGLRCAEEMKRTGSDIRLGLTPAQYLDKDYDLKNQDIGRPMEISKKSSTFNGTVWLCDDFPLDFREQIMPIVDMMSHGSAHFARLKAFIQLQLPAGFPVKVEIPLFHILSARITFKNVNKNGVCVSSDSCGEVKIDDELFEIPKYYRIVPNGASLSEFSSNSVYGVFEATNDHFSTTNIATDEWYLQLALERSLVPSSSNSVSLSTHDENELKNVFAAGGTSNYSSEGTMARLGYEQEDELQHAVRLSVEDFQLAYRSQAEQDEELERVLQLSLIEK